MEIETDGDLPADFRLPIDEAFSARLRRGVKCTSGPAFEARTIEKDAGVFVAPCDPLAMVLMDGTAEIGSDRFELPLVVA